MLVKSLSHYNWSRIRSDILKHWSRIKTQELDQTLGNLKKIRQLIISKYGNNGNILKDLNFIYQAALLDGPELKASHNEDFDEDMEATMLNPSLEKVSLHDLEMENR